MCWPAVAIIAASAIGAIASSQASSASADALRHSTDWQRDLAAAQWDRYLKNFAPIEEKLTKEVDLPPEQQPGYLTSRAAINKGYGNLEANLRRSMSGRYPSGSGLETETMKNAELSRTRDLAKLPVQYNQDRYNRMLQLANLGRNLPAQSLQAMGNVGNQQATLAGWQQNAAANTWGGIGTGAGNMAQWYTMTRKNPYESQYISPWESRMSGMGAGVDYPTDAYYGYM